MSHPIPGNDDSTQSIIIVVDVILDAIQSGAAKRVEAPTKRKDITPITQEPDFIDQEDEPEVTLPEGYDENDFEEKEQSAEPEVVAVDDSKSEDSSQDNSESSETETTEETES